jgi:hypothetical protein
MKNLAGPRLFLLALLPVAAIAMPARATVTWKSGFEMGDLSEWTSSNNSTKTLSDGTMRKNIEFSNEHVYAGSFACKLTIHPDDIYPSFNQNRVDMKRYSTLTGEGMDSYVSAYYLLPEDAKTRDEIFFYETKTTSRNWMDLWIEPKTGGGTTVKFGLESNGANLGSVLVWTGDWKPGVWHQFAIHVHWSTDATKGIVDLWFDGQQVVSAYKHKTKADTNDMYFQTGLHRVLTQPFVETIYFDDFIEADTQAEIKIGPPQAGGGPDGGTTDAAGGAGTGGGQGGSDGSVGVAGASGAAGGAAAGAAGAGTAGAAGATGTAGAIGAAGSGTNGAAGTTGMAGSGATGAAGAIGAAGTGGMRPVASSGGCTYAGSADQPTTLGLTAAGFLLSVLAMAHRRQRGRLRVAIWGPSHRE